MPKIPENFRAAYPTDLLETPEILEGQKLEDMDWRVVRVIGLMAIPAVAHRPRNLALDEVRAEHVKLSWSIPEDDGGTPITKYVVRVLDLEGGDWITMAEPKPENTNATLKGLRPGHLYQVEVCAQNKEGVGPPLRTKDPIKAENPYGKYFKSKSLDKILGDKDQK